jgi:hypothetical protein
MAGLDPAIHAVKSVYRLKHGTDVDGRNKSGHDGGGME